jgi:GNAT superfamily N-acetyltransferase
MIQIITAHTQSEIREFAEIALRNQLYVKGWCMKNYYEDIIIFPKNNSICLAYVDGQLAGCGIIVINENCQYFIKNRKYQACFYVLPKFRRMGVGSQLAQALKKCRPRKMFAVYGSKQSPQFFEHNKIVYQ